VDLVVPLALRSALPRHLLDLNKGAALFLGNFVQVGLHFRVHDVIDVVIEVYGVLLALFLEDIVLAFDLHVHIFGPFQVLHRKLLQIPVLIEGTFLVDLTDIFHVPHVLQVDIGDLRDAIIDQIPLLDDVLFLQFDLLLAGGEVVGPLAGVLAVAVVQLDPHFLELGPVLLDDGPEQVRDVHLQLVCQFKVHLIQHLGHYICLLRDPDLHLEQLLLTDPLLLLLDPHRKDRQGASLLVEVDHPLNQEIMPVLDLHLQIFPRVLTLGLAQHVPDQGRAVPLQIYHVLRRHHIVHPLMGLVQRDPHHMLYLLFLELELFDLFEDVLLASTHAFIEVNDL